MIFTVKTGSADGSEKILGDQNLVYDRTIAREGRT